MSRGPWRPIVLGCLGLLVLAVAWLGVMYARIVTDPSPSTDPHGYVRLFMALLTPDAMGTGTPGVTPPSLGSTSVLLVPGLVGLAVGLGMVLSGLRGQRALSPPQPAVWR